MIDRRGVVAGGVGLLAGCALPRGRERLLHSDDFTAGLSQWAIETQRGGSIAAKGGALDIDVPAGATIWFRPVLTGPIAIDYDVTAIAAGGANDAISDVNCFWMATDPAAPNGDVLARPRSGAFADYDTLRTYYAGIGGNRNTTSRFRRYIGQRDNRPLLPQHDLSALGDLLKANIRSRIRLIADGPRIALVRDGRTLFALDDPAPYTRGRFGFRTTFSHLRIERFRVWRIDGTSTGQ